MTAPQPQQPEADQVQTAISQSVYVLIAVLLIACLAGIGMYLFRPAEQVSDGVIEEPKKRASQSIALPPIPFEEITESAGIEFVHTNGAAGEKLLPETMGGGVGFFDFDNDGDQDLLLVNSADWPWNDESSKNQAPTHALYENDGTGQFSDVTEGSGLNVSMYGMGCAFGDFNGDRLTDIYITCVGKNHLFKNLGGGKFEDVTTTAGVAGNETDWGTGCGWFDYDNDGDLDLFVCNYLEWSRDYDKSQDFKLVGDDRAYGRPQSFGGTFCNLFENRGDETFVEVGKEAGLQIVNTSNGQPVGKSLGLAFYDFDDDGDLDVLVANDTVPNFLFENQGDKSFREIGTATGIAYDIAGNVRGAMGVDIAPFRDANAVGVAISNFSNEMTALYVSSADDVYFTDEAVSNGLGPPTRLALSFGIAFSDFDLDGRVDLVAANGHLENEIHRVLPSQTYEQSPQLFWNAGEESDDEFVMLSDEQLGDAFFEPIVGRGCAYADIDNDGDVDFILTALHGRPRLFRNQQATDHHWLRVKLTDEASGGEAIGAKVTVISGGQTQSRTISPTRSYLSQSELTATFGLAKNVVVDTLTVKWPSGKVTTLENVKSNRVITISESD